MWRWTGGTAEAAPSQTLSKFNELDGGAEENMDLTLEEEVKSGRLPAIISTTGILQRKKKDRAATPTAAALPQKRINIWRRRGSLLHQLQRTACHQHKEHRTLHTVTLMKS